MATTNKYLLCAVFALAFAGCAADGDIATGDGAGKDGKGKAYVTLSLSMDNVAPASRAYPTGGEAGDGYESGQSYENVVSSAVAFFFRGNGVNALAGTLIDGVAEFSQFSKPVDGNNNPVDKKIYSATPQQVDLENGEYQVIVVANPGDQEWWNAGTLTLGDVRDHIYKEAWKDANGTYSDFLMTSAADATLNLTPDATQQDPAEVAVTVERVAARIDYNADEQVYECTDPAYTGATVQITGAAIVNNLTAGSYLLKRVADDATGTNMIYLGDETAGSDGVPTNYVIDPWTVAKTEGNPSFTIDGTSGRPASALYGVWFGNQSSQTLTSELLKPGYWAALCTPGTALAHVEGGIAGYNRIGYTLENTTAADCAGPRYTTGVVFKAKFHPAGLDNYTDGATFFSRGSRLYPSMEAVMRGYFGQETFDNFDDCIDTCSTWSGVSNFADAQLDGDPSGYIPYLKNRCAAVTDLSAQLTAEDRPSLTWAAYMRSECGYSATQAAGNGEWTVTLNQNGKNTRTALRPHGVRTYEDAQCYYTWWVRHGNDNNDETNGVMEYGIVRNNVYKLYVKTVYSIGGDIPGEEGLNVKVYVKDWTLLETETLPM